MLVYFHTVIEHTAVLLKSLENLIYSYQQGWLQGGGWGGCIPSTGMKIYTFYMLNFLRRVSFCAREYYVPLTIIASDPPTKIFWSHPC